MATGTAIDAVLLAHGGGGTLTRDLVEKVIAPRLSLGNAVEADSAVVDAPGRRVAFTTDSYVVHPPFFPGGDIGRLAACGTINDLATSGARPAFLSLGLILEEGFAVHDLERILASVADAAREADTRVITGDTKVVERGAVDGIFINTAGIGWVQGDELHPRRIEEGDAVVVSGTLGEHGIAVMGLREGLRLSADIRSDVAPLAHLVLGALEQGFPLHAVRDLTRGGLAASMVEMASAAGMTIELEEEALPVRDPVRGLCDLLGLDPLTVANEGKMALVLPHTRAQELVTWLRTQPYGAEAVCIGIVQARQRNPVLLKTSIGGRRVITMPRGEQLPRIC